MKDTEYKVGDQVTINHFWATGFPPGAIFKVIGVKETYISGEYSKLYEVASAYGKQAVWPHYMSLVVPVSTEEVIP